MQNTMNITLWVNNKDEFNLDFKDEEEYGAFKISLVEAFTNKYRFSWPEQGFYLDTISCESIYMYEEI